MTDGERMLTAAEVKVLTETALRLGRAEAGEEIAKALESRDSVEWVLSGSYSGIDAAHIARTIGTNPTPLPAGATSDATSGVPGHPEVSEAVRSPQEDAEPVGDLVGALRKAVDAARERRLAEQDLS